jgi:MFS family permease
MKVESTQNPSFEPQENKPPAHGRSPLVVIFFTVFIDLVGFGIIIPLSPYLAREFHATPFQIGALLSIYSITQFLFSPFWGSLSDRIGRRPVILVGLLGGSAAYLLFAFSQTLWLLFVARGLAGVFGGNISTAHAYIADVTTAEERSKGMGMIGAAFGLGFIFGPLIGGGLGIVGQYLGTTPPLGSSFPALGAALICLMNFVFAYLVLRESLPMDIRGKVQAEKRVRRKRWREIWTQLSRPVAGPLMIVFFLSGFAMSQMEAMLIPYLAEVFKWDLAKSSLGFAYIGVLMVITQGYLVRKWMPKFGEMRTLLFGLGCFSLSLALIPPSYSVAFLGLTMTLLALGNGLMRPPNLGMVSLVTPADQQGIAMGVTNSLSSLARIIGPIMGGLLYEGVGRGAPFYFAGVIAFIAFVVVAMISRRGDLERALKEVKNV